MSNHFYFIFVWITAQQVSVNQIYLAKDNGGKKDRKTFEYERKGNTTYPRANGAKRRSGRKPGARVTNRALGKLKVVGDGRRAKVIR